MIDRRKVVLVGTVMFQFELAVNSNTYSPPSDVAFNEVVEQVIVSLGVSGTVGVSGPFTSGSLPLQAKKEKPIPNKNNKIQLFFFIQFYSSINNKFISQRHNHSSTHLYPVPNIFSAVISSTSFLVS